MKIYTQNLAIRSLRPDDERALMDMAGDGSLSEIFGDCSRAGEWMGGWLREAGAATDI